ncbi:MAG: YciI family protein, partial [Acidimicrobiaceae bacterium]
MRYLFAVIDSQTNSGTREEMVAIDAFNDKIAASGQRLMAAGLVAPRDAKVFDNRGDQALVSDGAINQTNEYRSGFWIID